MLKRIYRKLKFEYTKIRIQNNTKYFCIGSNKTGTTSIEKAFKELGFVVGNQRKAELLMNDYFENNFYNIIKYCKSAEVFQDVPFSCTNTFKYIDAAYPNSKFILTVRDSPDQWYKSLTSFHAKLFGQGNIPNWEDLKNTAYVYKGWTYNFIQKCYGLTDSDNPYDKIILTQHYEKRNQEIINYFKDRPNDLLVINLSEPDAYKNFCDFIGIKSSKNNFPWENKTEEIKI
jgi:hypothetical protein